MMVFIIGVLFWHIVGFWEFVTEIVLSGPTETQFSRPSLVPHNKAQKVAENSSNISTDSIEISANITPLAADNYHVRQATIQPIETTNCSAHQLDRMSGNIVLKECSTSGHKLGDGHGLGRQDMTSTKNANASSSASLKKITPSFNPQKFASESQLLTLEY